MTILVNFETFVINYFIAPKIGYSYIKQMDACNEKVDVLKISFWPFLGREQGEYFFSLFINILYLKKENYSQHFSLTFT